MSKKILVVDDEPINVDFFEVMLSKLGYTMESSNNGKDALEKVKTFHPDLILLDNIMPRMSGWEVTKILKSNAKTRDIPIIMLSALDDVKDKVEGFEMGIADYITKPFNFSEVLARIRVVLRNRELFSQLELRESRLALAQKMAEDIQGRLGELEEALKDTEGKGAAKAKAVLADLQAEYDTVKNSWYEVKDREIGMDMLSKE
jgi:DNA-binding response OmpR family regulator